MGESIHELPVAGTEIRGMGQETVEAQCPSLHPMGSHLLSLPPAQCRSARDIFEQILRAHTCWAPARHQARF